MSARSGTGGKSGRGGAGGTSGTGGMGGTAGSGGRTGRSAVPDLLVRIAERRRERLAEARGREREPQGGAAAAAAVSLQVDGAHAVPVPAGGAAVAVPTRAGVGSAPPVSAAAAAAAAAPPESQPELLGPRDNPFLAALTHPSRVHGAHPATPANPAIIGEVKMGSPRLGSLKGRIDPLAQARIYADNGAAALSVVVEPDFFFGSYDLLAECRAASGLPAVAKDFVVDPLQLAWARSAGADAVLLIAALYEPEELARYARLARGLGLVPLIEIHDAGDLASLAGESWELVGVNNRDLRTFEVDLERSIALLPSMPAPALKVAESGIRDALDVALLADSGFDALLIGESLLLAEDPAAQLRTLLGGREVVDA